MRRAILRKIVLPFLLPAMIVAFLPGLVAAEASFSRSPTEFTIRDNAGYIQGLPFETDTRDKEWGERGFIARPEPLRITRGDGRIVWDMSRYAYIGGDISRPEQFPDTVNPSLWRNAILNNNYGFYRVVSREIGGETRSIYQVRGFDIANMSFIETQNGFIVVDVLSYNESAAAAVKFFYDHLPADKQHKKIHTIIITHSHGDHYGGIESVLNSGKMANSYRIIVPDRFLEEAYSENVTVGPVMMRRSYSMYGLLLWEREGIPEGRGQMNNGLAIGSGVGTMSSLENDWVKRLERITKDGYEDFYGTRVEFIMAPHTEAPAQMVIFFPDYNSICLAEIVNQTQHNILTPRGAQVRDTLLWSGALGKMLREWVDGNNDPSELSAWGTHHWPRWGRGEVKEYIEKQRDLYKFLHDETVRLMNEGAARYDIRGMRDIAEIFTFPPELANEWFNRGYYGATVHNVKAVYQKYLGWFDNNPASLWQLPGGASAALYARYLGSGGDLLQAAQQAYTDGYYRWVVEVLEHIRLAPDAWGASVYTAALELQANAFEQMAYSTESGIWRNYFLTGAWRNRDAAHRGDGGGGGGCNAGFGIFGVLVLTAALWTTRRRS